MEERDLINISCVKKPGLELSFLLFTPENPRGRETWTMGEVSSRALLMQITVKLYGEYPSAKYPPWRMLGDRGIRKGGDRVGGVAPSIIHVQLIFKDPSYKRPRVERRHHKSHRSLSEQKLWFKHFPWPRGEFFKPVAPCCWQNPLRGIGGNNWLFICKDIWLPIDTNPYRILC